jgi:hypothetical protein
MTAGHLKRLREGLRADLFSPKDLLLRAAAIAAGFLLAHLADLRQHTTFLSGTLADPTMSWRTVTFLGGLYLVLYFAVMLLAPVLVLAAALLQFIHCSRRRDAAATGPATPAPHPEPSASNSVS